MAALLTSAAQGVFTVLFPSDCRICGAPLHNISRLPVCPACLDAMEPVRSPACRICGERLLPQQVAHAERLCVMCRQVEPPFARALAYGSYDAGLRDLVQMLKYQRVRPAAAVLGRMLAEVLLQLSEDFGERAPLVIPVPLHPARQRQRGFNQSELIARAAIRNFRFMGPAAAEPGPSKLDIDIAALLRARETQSQTGLTPHQRRANVRGAFRVARPDAVRGRDIVLVDDVFTTGTTAAECARVLRRAGAARVLVATVARVLKSETAAAPFPEEKPEQKEDQQDAQKLAAHG